MNGPWMTSSRRSPERSRSRGVVTLLAVAFAACGLASAASPAETPEEEIPVLTDTLLSDAIVVDITPACSTVRLREPEARVTWSVETTPGLKTGSLETLQQASEFRIDYSPYPDGLQNGRFESRRLDRSSVPEQSVVKADGTRTLVHASVVAELRPGVYYRARVLMRTESGWIASTPVGFLSSVCPVDGLDEDEE